MASGDSENVVLVSGLLEGYRLIQLKNLVGNLLEDSDALSTINWMNENEQKTPKAELHLQSQRDKRRLLDVKRIATFVNEETHFIVFSDGNKTNQEKKAAVSDTDDENEEEEEIFQDATSTHSSSRESMTSRNDDVTVQWQQKRIHCGDVPDWMFDCRNVKKHFERFGQITDLFLPHNLKPGMRPFAKVRFKTHEMAMAAIRYHNSNKGHRDTNTMFVEWDRVEARQIRHEISFRQVEHFRDNSESRASSSINQKPRPSGQQSRAGNKSSKSSVYSESSKRTGKKFTKSRRSHHDDHDDQESHYSSQDESSEYYDEADKPRSVVSMPNSYRSNTRRDQDIQRYDDHRGNYDKYGQSSKSGAAPVPKPRRSVAVSSKSKPKNQDEYTSSQSEEFDECSADEIHAPPRQDDGDFGDQSPAFDSSIHTWSELVLKHSGLFTGDPDRCVLLQATSGEIQVDELRNYLDSTDLQAKHKGIWNLPDGTLLELDNQETASRFQKKGKINLGDLQIKILRKKVPEVFEDRFLLQGTFEDSEVVETLLEGCDFDDDVIPDVTELDESKYLVEFHKKIDVRQVMKSLEETPLEEVQLKVSLVCRSDCVKVENLDDDVTNDVIRISFMSKKIGGGPVTKVERLEENDLVLVFFSNFQDAERLVKKSESQDILVSKQPVLVSLYYHSLSDDHVQPLEAPKRKAKSKSKSGNSKKSVVAPPTKLEKKVKKETSSKKARLVVEFRDTPELETDLVHYIRKSRKSFEALYKYLEDLAELEITEKTTSKGPSFILSYKPELKKLPDNLKQNQKRFETTCREISSKFFGTFVSRSATYDKANLAAVRRSNRWNEDHDLLKVEVEDESFAEAYVRWSVTNPGHVIITGSEHDVTAVLTYLKDKCDITDESVPFLKWQYRALVECDVIREITDQLKDKVNVKHSMKDDGGLVTFRGPSTCMHEARTKLTNALMNVTTSPLREEGGRTEFLLSSLKSERNGLDEDKVDVRQRIQEKFKNDKVLASLQLRGEEVCLLYTNPEQHRRALSSLEDLVKIDLMEVSEGFEGVVASKEWKRLSQNVSATGSTQIYLNKRTSTIEVVGLCYNFDENLRRVRGHVGQNVIVTSRLEERHVVVRFLREFRGVFRDAASHLEGVQVDYVTEENPSIVLKGKARHLEKAKTWLLEQSRVIQVRSHVIQDPGIPRYFRDRKGKMEVEEIAKGQQSIAIVDPSELELSRGRKNKRTKSFRAKPKLMVRIPSSTVTLRLIQCDITDSDCDAIVNASNAKLELRPAGISGAIMKKGGESIQSEMTKWKHNHRGDLKPGEVAVTNAGRLPFKRIIHAVGPIWRQGNTFNSLGQLRKCVKEVLRAADADHLTSIAIPAISCGVFGGKPHVCVPAIVEIVKNFAVKNEMSSVKRVDFVERSNQTIVSEFQTALSKLGDPLDEDDSEDFYECGQEVYETRSGSPPSHTRKERARTSGKQRLETEIQIGDLSEFEDADVIVTTAAPVNYVTGRGSAISRALYDKIGQKLEKSCRKSCKNCDPTVGQVLSTPGFNLSCKEIYHAILEDYKPKSAEDLIKDVFETCLKMADVQGYTSIAFPALGAGNFNYPPGKVARWFNEVVGGFEPYTLGTVHVVLFPGDQASIAAFQEDFDDDTSGLVNQQSSQTPGVITVNVTQGDITASTCDVIVSTTINLSGAIGKAIVSKGGPSIAAQLANRNLTHQKPPSRQFKSQTSNMIVTNGGNLACKYIFHINPPNSQSVTQVLLELYKNADALGMTSFAMPAIGTGGAGLNCQHVAKCCRESIIKFEKSHPNSSLQHIEIVIFQQNLVSVFQQEFAKQQKQQPTDQGGVINTIKGWMGLGGKSQAIKKEPSILPKRGSSVDSDSVSILICSKNTESANKVWKSIQRKIDDLSASRKIEDEAVEELDRLEQEEILRVMKKRSVKIEKTKRNVLTISGLQTNVLETCNDVQSLIHEFKQAQTCAQFIQWKYVDPNDNVARDFPLRTNQQLELDFKKNEKGTIALDVYLNQSFVRYSIDFSKMEQTCLNDQKTSKIERTNLTGEDPGFPPTWEDMGKSPWKKITLTQGAEYNAVLQKFKATLPSIRVVQLERIQSKALYKQFLAQKAKVESRMGAGSNVVRELFHGTAGNVCDSICYNGFDRSHAGKNATMYGKGVYFAVGANYSNGYATRDQNNHQRMFLADVVTGQHCVGNQSMNVAPMQANGSPYDSVTDNNQTPGIYVVFKDASVYPSYLLTYQ